MAISNRQWATIERRSGVPRHVMQVLLNRGERSGQNAVSPAGAFGRAQLMPATARALERKYRISARGEFGNVLAGALYLGEQKRHFGDWRRAFAAYNAGPGAVEKYGGVPPYRETQDYVKRTMSALGSGGGDLGRQTSPPASKSSVKNLPTLRFDNPLRRPEMPNFGTSALFNIAQGRDPVEEMQYLAEQMTQYKALPPQQKWMSGALPKIPKEQSHTVPGMKGRGKAKGKVILLSGADRAGMKTQQDILSFAQHVSSVFGRPLRVGTGTRHSQMTVNGRVSQHWEGHAVDIPASGATLTRMGQAALIAAGADPRWARKQKGGLFNVNGRQVIYNTNEGGNHWNHLHLGA